MDVETRLGFGWTPLMCAVGEANFDLAKLLLDRGANASFSKGKPGRSSSCMDLYLAHRVGEIRHHISGKKMKHTAQTNYLHSAVQQAWGWGGDSAWHPNHNSSFNFAQRWLPNPPLHSNYPPANQWTDHSLPEMPFINRTEQYCQIYLLSLSVLTKQENDCFTQTVSPNPNQINLMLIFLLAWWTDTILKLYTCDMSCWPSGFLFLPTGCVQSEKPASGCEPLWQQAYVICSTGETNEWEKKCLCCIDISQNEIENLRILNISNNPILCIPNMEYVETLSLLLSPKTKKKCSDSFRSEMVFGKALKWQHRCSPSQHNSF